MYSFRTPLFLLGTGLAAKVCALFVYHLFHPQELVTTLTACDPVGVLLADCVMPLLFDLHRIAPPPAAGPAFEFLLLVGFGVECLMVAFAFAAVHRMVRRRA